jgi:uncharacterized protein
MKKRLPKAKARLGITLVAVTLAAMLAWGQVEARELAVDPADLVEVELAGVGVSPIARVPLVLLRHLETGDVVPIVIGIDQAQAILMAMHGVTPPRPMTHDLAIDMLTALGATLERVLVDGMVDNTFLGMLELRVPGRDELVRVDSRPSDALALAVRSGAAILVAPSVLVAAEDLDYEGLPEQQVVTALGITVVEAGETQRREPGLADRPGVVVLRVIGEAARRGLEPGSMILEVNDTAVASPMEFLEAIRGTPRGKRVRISYWRDGKMDTVELDAAAGTEERRETPVIV